MTFRLKSLALIVAAFVAAAIAAAPASADRGHGGKGYGRGHVESHVDRHGGHRHFRHGHRKHRHGYHRHGPRRVIHTRRTVHVHRYEPPRRHAYRHQGHGGGAIDKSTGGTIVGALLGAAVGTQIGKGSGRTAAIIGGTVVGGILGHEIGRSMEEADRRQVQSALERTPTGQTIAWNNPDTGKQYAVTPTRTYRSADNRNCRDYTTWVFIGGYEEQVNGTACRMPDGSWRPEQG